MNITSLIPISAIFTIMFAHYWADFVFQTPWMAKNKSKSNKVLLAHIFAYSMVLFVVCYLFEFAFYIFNGQNTLVQNFDDMGLMGIWVLLNGVLHCGTDYFTSRKTSKLFGVDWHRFFEVVGFEQLIHYFCLFTTYSMFFPVAMVEPSPPEINVSVYPLNSNVFETEPNFNQKLWVFHKLNEQIEEGGTYQQFVHGKLDIPFELSVEMIKAEAPRVYDKLSSN